MIQTTHGSFVVVAANGVIPQYFWRGVQLTEITEVVAHLDDETQHIKLRVMNTTAFDVQYAEMITAGISVKKTNH